MPQGMRSPKFASKDLGGRKFTLFLSGFFLLAGILGFAFIGVWSWSWTQNWLLDQLRIQSEFVANTADVLLTSLDTGLPVLGEELGGATVEPTKTAYIVLSSYLRTHPYISNLALFSASGNMLLNTTVPYGTPLASVGQGNLHIEKLDQALRGVGAQLGRTQRNAFSNGWHISVLYVLRTAQGNPTGIIQADIPVDLLTGQWASMHLSPGTGLGLLRTDGYILARLPLDVNQQEVFERHFNGGLVKALMKKPPTSEGYYIGRVQVDNKIRVGAYTRLINQPAVSFVSLPRSYVWNVWLRQILPALGLGLMSLFGFIAFMGRFVVQERAYARSLAEERDQQAWIARHDPLTRLPNRASLEDRLAVAQARAARGGTLLAVALFDLDDFKKINDRFGHEAGDKVLLHLSMIFTQNTRATDYVVRLGGDEFVFLFEDLKDMDMLMLVLDRLENQLRQSIEISENVQTNISGSMGISIYPFDDAEGDLLLRHADQALYQVKSRKSRRDQFWALYEKDWIQDWGRPQVRQWLDAGHLVIHYQPILDLRTGEITSVEALARLNDPKNNTLMFPHQFLHGLVTSEDQYRLIHLVLKQVDIDAGIWARAGMDKLGVSINLPPFLLARNEWQDRFFSDLKALEISPDRVTFEVLETEGDFTLEHGSACMHELKSLGFKFALDDIGSAYSTLLRLKDLPVDSVKLDQGFVRELSSKPEDLIFVEALYDIAEVLEVDFIAEGVETASILDAMVALHIPKAQGYAIARPMPASQFLEWLQQYQPPPEKPFTLLGLYATHRKRDYFIHGLLTKNPDLLKSPLQLTELEDADVSRLLGQLGHGDTGLAAAYEHYRASLQRIIDSHAVDRLMVSNFKMASEAFDALLEQAIKS